MADLAEKTCVPCKGGVPALTGADLAALSAQTPDWKVIEEHHIEREVRFPDFLSALAFTNQVGELAEEQGHHPDIHLAWGLARVTIWTHKIDALTESDFVLAAKIDRLVRT